MNTNKVEKVIAAINGTKTNTIKGILVFDYVSTLIASHNSTPFFGEKEYEAEVDKLIERGAEVEKQSAMNCHYEFFMDNWGALKVAEFTQPTK